MRAWLKWGLFGLLGYGAWWAVSSVGLFFFGAVSLLLFLFAGIVIVSWSARREDSL